MLQHVEGVTEPGVGGRGSVIAADREPAELTANTTSNSIPSQKSGIEYVVIVNDVAA